MDSVRFGRALGVGARLAAKTLVTAVDAAAAPNPSAGGKEKATSGGIQAGAPRAAQRAARPTQVGASATVKIPAGEMPKTQSAARRIARTQVGLAQGSRRFGQAVWGPVVRLSGVLWLEFTGVFFGIFALSAGLGAWKLRGDMPSTAADHEGHMHFLWALVIAAVFGYFCVTSFLRARRRGRRS